MRRKLSILITNYALARRGGTEVVVRDLALGLLGRGHNPVVYAPVLGEVADEIAGKGISTIDDLRRLREPPDIIHAHHSVPAGEALLRFPSTPALFVCHSSSHWIEAPIVFPQIGTFVAVDEACRDRLLQTSGIDPHQVAIIPNAVDLTRAPARTTALPPRPARALAFGKAEAVPEIRRTCEKLGLEFGAIGHAVGRTEAYPERELVRCDIVFASARAALEAICCGCAVVVCDYRGIGGMVTSENFDEFRARNFGLQSLREPVSVDALLRAAARYDPRDAARVAERARREADLERSLHEYETLYRGIIDRWRPSGVSTDRREAAVAQFLHDYLPRLPADPRWPWMAEREKMARSAKLLRARLSAAQMEIARLETSVKAAAIAEENSRREQLVQSPSAFLRHLVSSVLSRPRRSRLRAPDQGE